MAAAIGAAVNRVLDWIERLQSALTDVFFVLTIVVVSFQVANRFWFKLPVVWTADLAVLCFIWLGFLAASVSVRRSGHFRVTMLLESRRLPGAGRRVLELASLAVILLVSGILVFEGARATLAGLHETAPGLRIPMAWAYAAVPLCSATAILFALEKVREQWRGAQAAGEGVVEAETA